MAAKPKLVIYGNAAKPCLLLFITFYAFFSSADPNFKSGLEAERIAVLRLFGVIFSIASIPHRSLSIHLGSRESPKPKIQALEAISKTVPLQLNDISRKIYEYDEYAKMLDQSLPSLFLISMTFLHAKFMAANVTLTGFHKPHITRIPRTPTFYPFRQLPISLAECRANLGEIAVNVNR